MNKYKRHVLVIPEDDRDRQIAVGFEIDGHFDNRQLKIMPSAGGWSAVIDKFRNEYIKVLQESQFVHVVMLIDFDDNVEERRAKFDGAIPNELRPRVFVIGPKQTPEALRTALGRSFEEIGRCLAAECSADTSPTWEHDHLSHNEAERRRLMETVKPFLIR